MLMTWWNKIYLTDIKIKEEKQPENEKIMFINLTLIVNRMVAMEAWHTKLTNLYFK